MTLSDLSIKRPVFAWMVMIGLIVFGYMGYLSMGVSQLPDVEFPVISIDITWAGAAPEVMESQVVDVIEQSIMSIDGVKDVSSSVTDGSASVTVELQIGRNIDFAVQEVQTKIAQAQRLLPKDIDPPIVTKRNPAQQPISWLALRGQQKPRELMAYVQDHLQDKFSTVRGVGDVALGGFVAPNLRVWIDTEKLTANELTVNDVVNAIQSQHVEKPAGRIETDKTEQNVRAMGEAKTVEDFGNILIPSRNGAPIFKALYLKDVAEIEDGLDDVRRISRSNGSPAIGLGIRKQTGSNEVEVSRGIYKKLAKVQQELPKGMTLEPVINRTRFIEDSIHELVFTLMLSALVTSIVCWIFLGSWSATLNILMAIPTSILGTFIVLNVLGFTLNTFTVLGLSLAIGIVVDDSIMVLENIVRYQEEGASRLKAAQEGARQITFAALAATISIIAIFLPVAFMTGIIGKFFFQFGVTISVAVAISLLEALMLTPMRCAQFLHSGERRTAFGKAVESSFRWLAESYGHSLAWALRFRWLVIIGSILFFIGSLYVGKLMRNEFVPPQDQSMFLVNVRTPVGSSITFTDERMKKVEKFIMTRPELDHYFSAVGGFGGGQVNGGNIFVTFKQPKDRPVVAPNTKPLAQKDLMILFRKEINKIKDVKAFIQDLSLSGFSAKRGFPIEMAIQGPDWENLWSLSKKIRDGMAKNSLFVDVDTDYLEGAKEIDVIPDRMKAAQHGVKVDDINQAVNYLIGGAQIAKYAPNDKRYDVRVRLKSDQRLKGEDIGKIYVWNNHGELVQLKELVTIKERPTAVNITRRARERAITVFANVAPNKSQSTAIAEARKIAKGILPEGYSVVFTGTTQTAQESNNSLGIVFILGIFVAYMVLASQFNSYAHPLTVLVALPFSISGALIALWMANQSMNLYSIIGLVLLMGIVKKNSILLVDFTNQMRETGLNIKDALLKACPVRLRPILMTSAATIAAAIPPAMAIGPGAEVRIPMSVAIIGGVFVSTIFTLFVVPCVYTLFAREKKNS